METVCDSTLVTATSWLTAWHWMLMLRSVGSTLTLMLVTVFQPPCELANFSVWFPWTALPSTTHQISTGGFEFDVEHSKFSSSPLIASEGPDIRTSFGPYCTTVVNLVSSGLRMSSFLA